jgi:hypothetical protein
VDAGPAVGWAVNCADPFWADIDPRHRDPPPSPTTPPRPFTEFAGASAPMEDLLVTFSPQSNPRLTQPYTDIFVQVGRVITAGQTVTVDTAQWQVYGTGGAAAGLYEDLEYGGRGTTRFFALTPEPGGRGTGGAAQPHRRRHRAGGCDRQTKVQDRMRSS